MDIQSLMMLMLGRDSTIGLIVITVVMLFKQRDEIITPIKEWLNRKNSVTLTANIVDRISDSGHSYRTNIPNEIEGILHYIKINPSKHMETTSGEILSFIQNQDDEIPCILPINSIKSLKINDDIEARFKLLDSDNSTKTEGVDFIIKHKIFRVSLTSEKPTSYIHNFIKTCMTAYLEYNEQLSMTHRRIYKSTNDGTFRAYDLNTTKSFDNLFFKDKEALIRRLESFKEKSIYQKLGINDGLGLMFYGEPGTGKTSTIKAIAKYMNMDIIIVPMNQLKTKKALEEFFYSQTYGYGIIPFDRRIYVFEEIDCNGWAPYIRDRNKEQMSDTNDFIPVTTADSGLTMETAALVAATAAAAAAVSDKKKKRLQLEEDKEPISLGAILECIDGLIETPGRIIIMTTNCPDFLDPAIRRPGRIDMEIEFKRLRRNDIYAIYQKMYDDHELSDDIIAQIPEMVYTQADISRLIFKHHDNKRAFITELCGSKARAAT